jgi:hypothetical protein
MGEEAGVRHTLDEASMLEILAAAELDTMNQAEPHSPEDAGQSARVRTPSRRKLVRGEQDPAANSSSDALDHGDRLSRA